MHESTETIKKYISECSTEEQEALKRYLWSIAPHPLEVEWNIDSDAILSAIRRSNDIMKRGVRGIIAEAVFERSMLPILEQAGWQAETILGDRSYDVHLTKASVSVRIQIKLQRLVKGEPFLYYEKHYEKKSLYVVEVQKTRTGKLKKPKKLKVSNGGREVLVETSEPANVETRPYSFRDFDILAVSMHPSSGNWNDFRYTVTSWLLPRVQNENLIEIMQPVAATPNDVWTSDLMECLRWLQSGDKRTVLTGLRHRKPKTKKPEEPRKPAKKKEKQKAKLSKDR